MPILQALVRNLFLLIAGFLSSFFLARLIDELRWMDLLRLRLASYSLAYVIALFCVVVINAITFTIRGVALAEISFGQWFSGTFNLALVYAFWSELFIQQAYIPARSRAESRPPDRQVVEHKGRLVSVPLTEVSSIIAAGDYVEIRTADHVYLDRQALHTLADVLGDDHFPRVHRSRLVNREHVESVTPLQKGRYRLHLADGSSITTSRGYQETVKQQFLASVV
jgi:DNA-binding LytR/AlgR family response regulator